MKFEACLKRLEVITENIRDIETPLEETMKLYEEGIRLSLNLEKELDSFERRVEILSNQPDETGNDELEIKDFQA